MAKERIRHLLVTEADRLVGILTDRDIRISLPSQSHEPVGLGDQPPADPTDRR